MISDTVRIEETTMSAVRRVAPLVTGTATGAGAGVMSGASAGLAPAPAENL